ncbi:MAG: hypothetical protein KZQ87_13400 [Candidatus Thiodiazotropha sp. (ex Cardiolucina cf. quadrata)]|nr:hypothetical protein [Candidatus Thiodiazotropha sp. (ex Cardiolucina cf. quadrata)]
MAISLIVPKRTSAVDGGVVCGTDYLLLGAILVFTFFSVITDAYSGIAEIGAGFSKNSRWAIDLSSRVVNDLESHHSASTHVLGFDYHKVLTDDFGDIGTLVFQPYIVKLNNVPNPPFFFDDGDDTELTWRIANFNYTALSEGKFNIRAGHFEIPFGLEQNIDSNGTLRQYTFSDRGIKADWGISINGILPSLEYEVALTRGSGNDIESRGDPYVFAGRIGLPSHRNLIAGLSWFHGDVLGGNGITKRDRVGLDVAYYQHHWELLFELSGGDDDGGDRVNSLMEVSWRNAKENLHLYIQWIHLRLKQDSQWEAGDDVKTGISWRFINDFELSAQYQKQIDMIGQEDKPALFILQVRWRI